MSDSKKTPDMSDKNGAPIEQLSPTKRKLYALMLAKEREREAEAARAERIPRRAEGEAVPLSFSQEQLWLLDRLEGGYAYNIPLVVRLTGSLDEAALGRALARVAERHETLRTFFVAEGGRPSQEVRSRLDLPLSRIDLSALDEEKRASEALHLAAWDNLQPYDLGRGPLFRAHLLRLAGDDHVLVINIHHIISDVWSLSILVQELGAFYMAEVYRQPAPLPPLPVQFGDYASWQRKIMEGERLDELLAFWRETLSGAPPVLELETDHPRPSIQAFDGAEVPLRVPGVIATLKEIARESGTTLFVVLLAAFDALLLRYTGKTDFLVGTPVAGRGRSELEGLIGFFVNSVVLRADLSGRPTFAQLVERLRRTTQDGLDHESMPFEKLVEALKPPRDPSRSPLFQVMFAIERPPALAHDLPGLRLRPMRIALGTAKFDLTLFTEEAGEDVGGRLEYNAMLFEQETAERLLEHYGRFIQSVVEDARAGIERTIDALPLLGGAERKELLGETIDAGTSAETFTEPRPLHQLFESWAASAGDRQALSFGDETWTYQRLDCAANQLAHRLLALGVQTGELVGLSAGNSPAVVEGILGILKAGGAYLPLDPAHPAERQRLILDDAGIRVLIVGGEEEETSEEIRGAVDQVVDLKADAAQLGELPDTAPGVEVDPASLAYVIYTSGSTGRPKGTLISHGMVTRLLRATESVFDFGTEDVWTLFHSNAFDFSVWEIWGALAYGGRLVVVPWLVSRSPADFLALLEAEPVSVLNQTPSAFKQLLNEVTQRQANGPDNALDLALRWVIFGGEALDPRELEPWFDLFGDEKPRLVNMYGITETTVHVTHRLLTRADATKSRSLIGAAIDDLRLRLTDARGYLAPFGSAGEICVGGAGLASGYLRRPALTAERFVPDPWSANPGERLYRSGDRGRFRQSGDGLEIEYLGRLDHQIKLRGFRIELGEIEAALRRLPEISQAVALLRSKGASERLIAWLVRDPATVVDENEGSGDAMSEKIAASLRRELPDYMVPSTFVFLDSFPLTANGKLDRAALPVPRDSTGSSGRKASGGSSVERSIAALWADALELDHVGLDDNFFDLGGHSMLLVEVHGRLRDELGVDLEVVDLFQHPTVRTLAARLETGGADQAAQQASRERGLKRRSADRSNDIAIIASAIRVTGADTPEAFWNNLADGVEGIERFSEAEALEAGVSPEQLAAPNYILSEAPLEGVELFDADFFGYSPREAESMDPQQRLYLELAWEAFERAGYEPSSFAGQVGVWASAAISSYAQHNLQGYDPVGVMGNYFLRVSLLTGNSSDFLAQRICYHLGLEGPAVNVQTACSSSLVAVHMACESLLRHECDLALAGGTQVRVPQRMGYLYMEGGLPSPDGYCRPFDVASEGTVHGNGLGAVVLKRLDDAIRDGDRIEAVLKGSAVNNDGSQRVGFTAPSVEGQTRVVTEALATADMDPATIGFVEAHGTGTEFGDSIEVKALTQAYRAQTSETTYCALGSVKSNLGHLDTTGGITSLIKAALSLDRHQIPPTLNFTASNPKLRLDESPFFVNNETIPWEAKEEHPRRAGVNSFAIGGTNVHLLLEEAPEVELSGPSREWQILPISARSTIGLHQASQDLGAWFNEQGEDCRREELADAAFTLSTGRKGFAVRRVVLARDPEGARQALKQLASPHSWSAFGAQNSRPKALVIRALDSEGRVDANLAATAAELLRTEATFRTEIEKLTEVASTWLDQPLPGAVEEAANLEGAAARATAFAASWALARLWQSWGFLPEKVVGLDATSTAVATALDEEQDAATALRAHMTGQAAEASPLADLFALPEPLILEIGATGVASHRDAPLAASVVSSTSLSGNASGEELPPAPLVALAQLWTLGLEVDWTRFWQEQRRSRVVLPTYPFERGAHWVEPPKAKAAGDSKRAERRPFEERFQASSFERRPWVRVAESPGSLLVVTDGSELAGSFLEELGDDAIECRPGAAFSQLSEKRYQLAIENEADVEALFDDLGARIPAIDRVAYFAGEGREASDLWGLVHLLRAFERRDLAPEIGIVASGLCEVTGEETWNLDRAPFLALARSWRAASRPAFCIDPGNAPASFGKRLASEFGRSQESSLLAWRGGYRWHQTFTTLDLETTPSLLRSGGVYLLVDHGSGTSVEFASALAEAERSARLVVASPVLPERSTWATYLEQHEQPGANGKSLDSHPVVRQIRNLEKLEQSGVELLVVSGEAVDAELLERAVRSTRERFGDLDGVIHALFDRAFALDEVDLAALTADHREATDVALAEVEALDRVFSDDETAPDFCLFLLSASGLIGDPKAIDRALGDLRVDHFVAERQRRARLNGAGTTWRAAHFDVGMETQGERAADLLSRLLAEADLPQIAISAYDLNTRATSDASSAPAEASEPGAERRGRERRPALGHPPMEPSNAIERDLRDLWEELFGIDGLGITDDFYELGGHSLLAVRMVSYLRDNYGVDLQLREALEVQTIQGLAALVAEKQIETAVGSEDFEALLSRLESMSDEEAIELSTES